ncbi:MAG: DNA-packaging protein [Lachnospiraceae bacterium]|nr:DNA-packaging protein [Lachnospiraceae bacterium]
MGNVNEELVSSIMEALRVKASIAKEEIADLVEACKKDLEIAGVYITDEKEALSKQAIKLYCKANYGYDKDSDKFRAAYAALRDSMALSGDYRKAGE